MPVAPRALTDVQGMTALMVLMFATQANLHAPVDRGAPRLPPGDVSQGSRATQALPDAKPATMFVNFDGATLNGEQEDARSNSTLIGFEGEFEAYGEGAKRLAVLQAVREDWEPFAITVTDERPASGDYTMVMVGPTNFTGTLGIAMLDCANDWTDNNVVFAFHSVDDGFTAGATATTIGQEVAHAFGLEHVDDEHDILNPSNKGGNPRFIDGCRDVVPASGIGIACTEQHLASCGDEEQQNSYAELMRAIGPRPVDVRAPSIAFMTPHQESTFEEGEMFVLEVDADDDHGVTMVELLYDGESVAFDDSPPYSWEVNDAPAGRYAFTAIAYDASGNMASSEDLAIFIEDLDADTDSSGGEDTDGGEPSFGSTGDDDDGRGDVQPLSPAELAQEAHGSDGCTVIGSRPKGGALVSLALCLLFAARREPA